MLVKIVSIFTFKFLDPNTKKLKLILDILIENKIQNNLYVF